MSLTVLEPGFQTLRVDRGRRDGRHRGLPLGGPADRAALALANGLVGNSPEEPALEFAVFGPTLRAESPTACAIFGAPFLTALANKCRVPAASSFNLEAGDVVKIAASPHGVRAYFAVAGGFNKESATAALAAGHILNCRPSRMAPRSLPFDTIPITFRDGAVVLRALPGPQFKSFLKPESFFDGTYEVTPTSNRMGLRLTGTPLERRAGELPSEAVAPGAVQVTNDGMPVVLGVDGQTIGGYPKIAHVIRADLDVLGQLRPGAEIVFERVNGDEAERAAAERRAFLDEWLTRLAVTARSLQ